MNNQWEPTNTPIASDTRKKSKKEKKEKKKHKKRNHKSAKHSDDSDSAQEEQSQTKSIETLRRERMERERKERKRSLDVVASLKGYSESPKRVIDERTLAYNSCFNRDSQSTKKPRR